MKAERVNDGRHITDMLDGEHFVEGQKYMVTFPDGTISKMPAIILKQIMVQTDAPFLIMREQAFFSVQHRGLAHVWCRAVDMPDVAVIDPTSDVPDEPTPPVAAPRRKRKA